MCLIIYRPQGVILPEKDFITAVANNPHGYGFSTPDMDGELYTFKSVTDKDTDGEALYELLHTEFKDERLLIHLRYNTAGDTCLRNAHPFPVLEKGRHGVDVRMTHNGTLSKFKPSVSADNSWESDTRVFTRTFVRPVFERMAMAIGPEEVMMDTLTHDLMYSQLTSASVLVFMDGHGDVMYVNEKGNGGFFSDDGCYFSNKYSFDEWHRYGSNYGYTNSGGYRPTGKHGKPVTSTTTTTAAGNTRSGSNPSVFSAEETARRNKAMADTQQEKFSDVFSKEYGIEGIEDMLTLSDDTIEALVKDERAANLFIKELLCHGYTLLQVSAQRDRERQRAEEAKARVESELHDAMQRVKSQSEWIANAKKGKKSDKAA